MAKATPPWLPPEHVINLTAIAEDLENGYIKARAPSQADRILRDKGIYPQPEALYMAYEHCGTVACIGGHLAYRLGLDPIKFVDGKMRMYEDTTVRDVYYELFWEYPMDDDYVITANRAAKAIRRFLDGKKPWLKR